MSRIIRWVAWGVVLVCVLWAKCASANQYFYQNMNHSWGYSGMAGNGTYVVIQYDGSTQRLTYNFHVVETSDWNTGMWLAYAKQNQDWPTSTNYVDGYGAPVRDVSPSSTTDYSGFIQSPPVGTWFQIGVRNIDMVHGSAITDQISYIQIPTTTYHVTLSLRNDRDVPITFKVVDANGQQVGNDMTLQPHTATIQTVVLPANYALPLSVLYCVPDYTYDGLVWRSAPGSSSSPVVATVNSVPSSQPNVIVPKPPADSTTQVPVDAPTTAPSGGTATASSGGTVWRSTTGNVTTDGLTNTVFREGVDKITSRLDPITDNAKQAKTDRDAWTAFQNSDIVGKATPYGDAIKAKVTESFLSGNVGVSSAPTAGNANNVLSFAMEDAGGSYDVRLLPGDGDGIIGEAAGIIKALVAVLLAYAYCRWFYDEAAKQLITISQARQAQGNAVMGSGGQATASIAAVLITALVFTGPPLYAALLDTGLLNGGSGTNSGILDFFSFAGSGNIGSAVYSLLSSVFPTATFVSVCSGYLVTRMYFTGLTLFFVTIIRHIVPAIVLAFVLAGSVREAKANVQVRSDYATNCLVCDSTRTPIVAVNAHTDAAYAPVRGNTYYLEDVSTGAGLGMVEVLDEGTVYVAPDGKLTVTHPMASWLPYLWRGFITGFALELAGLSYRLLYRLKGSQEAP